LNAVNLKSLKVFCDVVSRRSFSKAADSNGLTQSGASQVVHHLEERLGVKLIDRSKRPFVLTAEGEVYYEGCRNIVQRYFALEEDVRMLRREVAGRVRVASIYSVGLSHMNEFIQHFMGLYPKANIRLDYEHPQRVYELVENDQVDLGLVSFPKSSRKTVAVAWREEPMVFVCSPQHPLAQRDEVRLQDLRGVSIVGFDQGLKIRRAIDRALEERRVDANVVMAFDNIETLKRAIEINAGVSILPEPTVVREVQLGSLVVRPLAGERLVRPIGIIYRRGKELGVTARRFMQLLQEYPATSSSALSSTTASGGGAGTTASESVGGSTSTGNSNAAAGTSHAPSGNGAKKRRRKKGRVPAAADKTAASP
jgi:DNA-binding transcriptional LysR family regulator